MTVKDQQKYVVNVKNGETQQQKNNAKQLKRSIDVVANTNIRYLLECHLITGIIHNTSKPQGKTSQSFMVFLENNDACYGAFLRLGISSPFGSAGRK